MEGGVAQYPLVGLKIITARGTHLRFGKGVGFGVSGQGVHQEIDIRVSMR
eukprot:SAG31_NODE_32424_length_356_cov_0.677043_2_plen_49_part_01